MHYTKSFSYIQILSTYSIVIVGIGINLRHFHKVLYVTISKENTRKKFGWFQQFIVINMFQILLRMNNICKGIRLFLGLKCLTIRHFSLQRNIFAKSLLFPSGVTIRHLYKRNARLMVFKKQSSQTLLTNQNREHRTPANQTSVNCSCSKV